MPVDERRGAPLWWSASLAPWLAPSGRGSPRIALKSPNSEPGAGIEPATIRLQVASRASCCVPPRPVRALVGVLCSVVSATVPVGSPPWLPVWLPGRKRLLGSVGRALRVDDVIEVRDEHATLLADLPEVDPSGVLEGGLRAHERGVRRRRTERGGSAVASPHWARACSETFSPGPAHTARGASGGGGRAADVRRCGRSCAGPVTRPEWTPALEHRFACRSICGGSLPPIGPARRPPRLPGGSRSRSNVSTDPCRPHR